MNMAIQFAQMNVGTELTLVNMATQPTKLTPDMGLVGLTPPLTRVCVLMQPCLLMAVIIVMINNKTKGFLACFTVLEVTPLVL